VAKKQDKQTSKQIETEYDGSTPLKSIMQEMFVNNLLKGMPQYEAYKQAGYKGKTEEIIRANSTHALTSNNNIKARLEYKRADIEQQSGIDIVYCRQRLLKLADEAEKEGKRGTARACISDIIKTIGGFKADEPSDKAIALKQIDAEARREVAKALDKFYTAKHLAARPDVIEAENVVVLEDC